MLFQLPVNFYYRLWEILPFLVKFLRVTALADLKLSDPNLGRTSNFRNVFFLPSVYMSNAYLLKASLRGYVTVYNNYSMSPRWI